jgi:hypothetical protein
MGTSTTYGGPPQWKSVKSAVSRAAGQGPLTSHKAASTVRDFVTAMASSNTGGFGNGSKGTGGGGGSRSRRIGGRSGKGSGIRGAAASVGQFLRDVQRIGLREVLRTRGCEDIDDFSPTELVLLLADVLGGADSTIDGSDLTNALCDLLRELTENAENIEQAEKLLQTAATRLEQIVRDLIGYYIFERYNTTMSSRLDGKLNVKQADASLMEVRRFIDTEIQLTGTIRDLSNINWRGAEGTEIIEEILQQTIAVFMEPL